MWNFGTMSNNFTYFTTKTNNFGKSKFLINTVMILVFKKPFSH